MADLGHIKGAAFGEFVSWFARHVDRARVEAVVSSLRQPGSEGLAVDAKSYGILASSWYPAALVHEIVDRLTAGLPPRERERIAVRAATDIMNSTLSGVYRFIFSTFATPERYARHVDKLWSLHYDSGHVLVEERAPGLQCMRYEQWRSHHPYICLLNMASAEAIYGAMGCQDVRWTRLSCIAEDGDTCSAEVSWRV